MLLITYEQVKVSIRLTFIQALDGVLQIFWPVPLQTVGDGGVCVPSFHFHDKNFPVCSKWDNSRKVLIYPPSKNVSFVCAVWI